MTTYMFDDYTKIDWSKIICVTNRKLCQEDFLTRIEKIAKKKPQAIILREKDLTGQEYTKLAQAVINICQPQQVTVMLHKYTDCHKNFPDLPIHVPLPILRQLPLEWRKSVQAVGLGTSCHSLQEAREAINLGCTYLVAGHIFATDCKQGLPGRGLAFLQEICQAVAVPVYAIGGITPQRLPSILATGAAGACIMSGLMQAEI